MVIQTNKSLTTAEAIRNLGLRLFFTEIGIMKILLGILLLLMPGLSSARVRTGVEVLRDGGFEALRGKRVGLVTNPTGVDSELRSTIDILAEAPEVELAALFAPEHGVRGDVPAGARVTTSTDPQTGVKVYSLYGATRKPTRQMLAGLDVLVYDIQDIGCRSYTFISTLGELMEACAANGVSLMVLDRPNPLGGERVEGPFVVEPDCRSFVSRYSIPYVYGLTPGELARYLNATEFDGRCDLQVVKMEGWERSMTFEDTGLVWVPTSPNIPTAETALYYPATGIMGELGTVNIGANYTMPFKVALGADFNAAELARRLNALGLPGVKFRPCHMQIAGKRLQGVQPVIHSPEEARLTSLQFYVMQELAAMGANVLNNAAAARVEMFDKVCGSRAVRKAFARRMLAADVEALLADGEAVWRAATEPYLLY